MPFGNETTETLSRILDTPHLSSDHPLGAIVDASFAARGVESRRTTAPKVCWGAERFHLQKSAIYARLAPEEQHAVLVRLTELNLSLSYFIEKSGHEYAAKMIQTSSTLEEKTLYALFANEEATHLRMFMNEMWFTPNTTSHFHPVLPALAEAIEWGGRDTLVFVIQVLLEGFGIAHYSGLKETCMDAGLKTSLASILRDESRHHGAGLVLAKAKRPDAETADQIFELSRRFIRSFETAHWIPAAFDATGKPLSSEERKRLFADLDFGTTLGARMARLREMFEKVNYRELFERLESDGAFRVTSV
ncbi:MAG: ferritin-like domain-containing protein [Bdellovibrionales bacterium]|nr:ferritin-like domain-containing protein [Bdellovibrionales bacterium]